MSQTEIEEIVSEFRKSTYEISDEDVEDILKLCRRKIEITGQQKRSVGNVQYVFHDTMSSKMSQCTRTGCSENLQQMRRWDYGMRGVSGF